MEVVVELRKFKSQGRKVGHHGWNASGNEWSADSCGLHETHAESLLHRGVHNCLSYAKDITHAWSTRFVEQSKMNTPATPFSGVLDVACVVGFVWRKLARGGG